MGGGLYLNLKFEQTPLLTKAPFFLFYGSVCRDYIDKMQQYVGIYLLQIYCNGKPQHLAVCNL